MIRIGNADAQVADARRLRMWVSARDLAQLVRIGLTHPDVRHDVVYGVSDSPHPMFSNHRARALGYRPQDNAADHLAPGYLDHAAMDQPGSGRDFVGGAYAGHALTSLFDPV
ncbi:MAG: Uronate dehydrogenase [Paracidovorax wautersii]|uniref:Uronate dehydrogenase n=1 Tax=Paracidovorax wautersii TaxID=1177982 RepID=A0A7V8FMV9_9BURK|nr:MAG: Uronate dehydrogenase [Paracidovorax wautersii]